MTLKDKLKNKLTFIQLQKVRKLYTFFATLGIGRNLGKLAAIYKTDKWGDHFYTSHYETHFQRIRWKRINLLEIGIGGDENPRLGGASLRMWKRYFPFGRIYAFDIHDKSLHAEHRIRIFKGDQNDPEFLTMLTDELPDPDIIIDDGSHINEHVIHSFEHLFPKLKNGGIYVVEDTQTSYWKEYGGGDSDSFHSPTIMNYFKSRCDGLNYKEFRDPDHVPDYFDLNIKSVQFYHNLIFIFKGLNKE